MCQVMNLPTSCFAERLFWLISGNICAKKLVSSYMVGSTWLSCIFRVSFLGLSHLCAQKLESARPSFASADFWWSACGCANKFEHKHGKLLRCLQIDLCEKQCEQKRFLWGLKLNIWNASCTCKKCSADWQTGIGISHRRLRRVPYLGCAWQVCRTNVATRQLLKNKHTKHCCFELNAWLKTCRAENSKIPRIWCFSAIQWLYLRSKRSC